MKSINCLLIIIVFASWGPERSGLVNNIFLSFLKTELIMALVGRRGVSSSDKTKERGGRDRGESQVWPSRSKVTHSRALSIWGRWRVENSGHLTIITQPTTNTTTQGRDGMGTNTRRGKIDTFQSYRSWEILGIGDQDCCKFRPELYGRYLTSWNIWLDLPAPTIFNLCENSFVFNI